MHTAIWGTTRTGKSSLAKEMARVYQSMGIKVLVHDPVFDSTWPADFKTDNFELFLEVYWESEGCMCFFDEAYKSCFHKNDAAIATATMGRHRGHINHYIAHRPTMIDVTIREQCTKMFLFRIGKKDAKLVAEDWSEDVLLRCNEFKQGQYFEVEKMGEVHERRLF
ncbi:MAG: ATP-binding protein [Gammaproteobacteria bacterium]|nr:ATP-binding protein [Gammaproteobacteria bacterium]MBL4572940.1 ATP-binding protein [Gammaproteobacteria bacterium]